MITIDTEGTGLTLHHGCRPFMIQVCDGTSNYYWCGTVDPYDRTKIEWNKDDLLEFLEMVIDTDCCVFHNSKYDIRAIYLLLKQYNLERGFLNLVFSKFEDTMLMCHAAQSGFSVGLKQNSLLYLDWFNTNERVLKQKILSKRGEFPHYDLARKGHPSFGGETKSNWYKMDYWLDLDACKEYGLTDVEMTYRLFQFLKPALEDEGLWEAYCTRKKLTEVFYHLEDVGMNMYVEKVDTEIESLTQDCEQLRTKIEDDNYYQHHLDLDTVNGLLFLIHSKLGIKPTWHTPSGSPSVKKDAVDAYIEEHPDIQSLQDLKLYRQKKTRISDIRTYANWLCDDGRLRSYYWITGTRETRQAVEKPNIQNIGKGIRTLFGPPQGKVWLDFDLVNIEMRLWVYEVGDEDLIKVFEEGGSVHLLVAEALYPKEYAQHGTAFKEVFKATLYQWVKNGNFSIIYGATERKADLTYRKKGAYRQLIDRFPAVQQFSDRCKSEAAQNYEIYNQNCVTVTGGYRLDIPLSDPHKASNYKIQGSAGWIMGESMINVYNNPDYKSILRDSSCGMFQQVHDSLVIELYEDDLTPNLCDSIKHSIEEAGLRYMPTNEASFDIVTHYTQPNLKYIAGDIVEV